MNRPLRGVNLGGWLVLEPWITPSLFAGSNAVDEYSFCMQGAAALRKLKHHRDTFITEQDIAWLASNGIDLVRLPVGYWLFGEVRPYAPALKYVDKVFGWAKKYSLRVLIDLHGAPGSQNGEMHSGRQGAVGWNASQHQEETLHVLERLSRRYGQHSSLFGISLLNEPSPRLPTADLQIFYEQAHTLLRSHCRADTWIVFSDAFRPARWRRLFRRDNYPAMAVDYHHYQIFSWLDKRLPAALQIWRAKYLLPFKLHRMSHYHAVFVGEWSAALPDGKLKSEAQLQNYLQAQLSALNNSDAWFYWTYKTEFGGSWSFRDCKERGLIA